MSADKKSSKCKGCGKDMNPVDYAVSPYCRKCADRGRRAITGEAGGHIREGDRVRVNEIGAGKDNINYYNLKIGAKGTVVKISGRYLYVSFDDIIDPLVDTKRVDVEDVDLIDYRRETIMNTIPNAIKAVAAGGDVDVILEDMLSEDLMPSVDATMANTAGTMPGDNVYVAKDAQGIGTPLFVCPVCGNTEPRGAKDSETKKCVRCGDTMKIELPVKKKPGYKQLKK